MPKKKAPEEGAKKVINPNVMGLRPEVLEQPITETLEINYMPYAMSVIVSRAIPEIDGFKPSHRKLLYTMYQMHLLGGARTKSANVVGQTMKLNPHGDAAIYDTMVRLSRGYGALLHPLVDSKGNFGKVYSRDMAWAASRYTEVRLDSICAELFRDIDQDTVDFVDNYDGSMQEPTLLPTTFPNVLVSANQGIAVGMASNLCGFNLGEVCDATVAFLKNPQVNLLDHLKAPDFPTGGELLYDEGALRQIYETGRGSFQVRAKWRYLKGENLIEIYEIPYTTTVEAIMDKVAELVKGGKIREIADMRDETDLNGLKITIDLKRGTDPDKLMAKLFRSTTLQDSFSCNFNILIAGNPRVMGVGEILDEWIAWRMECIRRRVFFDLQKKRAKLHLLQGLGKILLDIDRAIAIIRNTEREADVVPNLMAGFDLDEVQANFVAEIKLRNINREYILKRTAETDALEKDIADLEATLESKRRIRGIIIRELKEIIRRYPSPRRTGIVAAESVAQMPDEDLVPDYPVQLFLSREGYFKKITPQSLRMSGEQKYKDGDELSQSFGATNRGELLIFTDRQQVYKAKLCDFADTKASVLGVYLPTVLSMDADEHVLCMVDPGDYRGELLLVFENGKAARIPVSAYETKTNRRRLTGAYSDKSPLVAVLPLYAGSEVVLFASDGRALLFPPEAVPLKASRTTQGVAVMALKKKAVVTQAQFAPDTLIHNHARYRARSLPAAGALLREDDRGEEQMSLI